MSTAKIGGSGLSKYVQLPKYDYDALAAPGFLKEREKRVSKTHKYAQIRVNTLIRLTLSLFYPSVLSAAPIAISLIPHPIPPLPTPSQVYPTSWLSLLKTTAVAVPTILLFAPLALISQKYISSTRSSPPPRTTIPKELADLPIRPLEEREHDITIMGATGFCGRICLEYYLANYPDLKVAIAGRNQAKVSTGRNPTTT